MIFSNLKFLFLIFVRLSIQLFFITLQKMFVIKKVYFIFIFICILFSNRVYCQKVQYKIVAVASYNCENLFDTEDDPNKMDEDFTPNGSYSYTEEIYKQKLHNISTVIQKMGTDVTPDGPAVIGLVEIENSKVLKDLVSQPEIINRNYKYLWFPTSDERGISTAMLYNPKYLKVLNAEPIKIPMESIGQHRPTRDILFASAVLDKDTMYFLINHWPSKSGGEVESAPGRILVASINKHIIDSLTDRNPNSKILLMGDLNDNPTSDGVIKVLKAKAEKANISLTDIYNPWINMYKKGIGTESYQGEWNLIDQIMLSGGIIKNNNNKWTYYNAEIYNKSFLVNKIGKYKGLPHRSFTVSKVWDNGYSDHFPVLIYLISK